MSSAKCAKDKHERCRVVAGPPRSREFNEKVAADVFMITDLSSKEWPCLVMVDLATGFTAATVLRDANSRNLASKAVSVAVESLWAGQSTGTLAGGQGSHFRGIVGLREASRCTWRQRKVTVKMEATEQRVGQVKDMCDKIFDELSVRGEDAVGAGFVAAANATNKLVFEGGFSSNQWVLGQQVRLPASLLDPEARVVEHGNALESAKCWEKTSLERGCIRCDLSDRQRDETQEGSLVESTTEPRSI